MRILRSLSQAGDSRAPGQAASRPEALRRATLMMNSRFLAFAGVVALPLTLYWLVHGLLLPIVLALICAVTGAVTLVLQQRGYREAGAAGQVYGILVAGLVMTCADPAVADFGLAVALLAPIHAALVTDAATKRRAWILLAVVVGVSIAGALGLPLWPQPYAPAFRFAGGAAFAVAALVVAHTANRLNTAFEVYDRSQINAYRHLIEHVQDAVLRFSSEGDLLFASQSSEKLFGCKRYQLTDGGLVERIHVLDRPAYLTAFAEANRDGRARTVEVRVRFDGSEAGAAPQFIWIEMALSPVIDNEPLDDRHEVVALCRDVTSRRDQDNEMRDARKAAEAASEAKSRFLATIGHELRTPLSAIIGFSEMMASDIGGELSPTHREYAELIHKSGSHLIGVVGMLLDMSRLEAGKFELNAESFSPETLVEPSLAMVRPLTEGKRIDIEVKLAPRLPALVADERACRQIIINLLSNAIKFSHVGGTVTLSMKRRGAYLAISVADAGIGMSTEAMARIGEPFFQANDGLSRRYEGTGLGLSIVKGLVDLHEGSLRPISEPGRGTTMTVLLPINGPATKMPENASVTPLRQEAAPQPVAPWPEKKRSAR